MAQRQHIVTTLAALQVELKRLRLPNFGLIFSMGLLLEVQETGILTLP